MKKLFSIILLLITFLPFYLFTSKSPVLADCAFWDTTKPVKCISPGNLYCDTADECKTDPKATSYEAYREAERAFTWYPQKEDIHQNLASEPEGVHLDATIYRMFFSLASAAGDAGAGLPLEVTQRLGLTPNKGTIGAMGNIIAGMTGNPPVYTGTYIADVVNNMGIVTPAYAQDEGTGWTTLTSILEIWKAFRNIAYLGFVIIFVIVGFMIMFRAQINPQTVVTIQAALPKIIFTLLLVTFSYAIASLMIDLIYVLIYLMINILGAFNVVTEPSTLIDKLLNQHAIEFMHQLLKPWDSPASAAADAVGDIVNNIVGKNVAGAILNFSSDVLFYVIIVVAILIAMFKLFFQLLMAYIGIIFSVIFAPITLLFNALPNSNSFSGWLKALFANAIIFPVVALLFVLAGALTGAEDFYIAEGIGHQAGSLETGRALVLPFVGGGFDTDAMQALIGIGCIMIMPKIVEMVQKMLGIEGGIAGLVGTVAASAAAPIQLYQGIQERKIAKEEAKVRKIQMEQQGGP